jgi:hypothetical protein
LREPEQTIGNFREDYDSVNLLLVAIDPDPVQIVPASNGKSVSQRTPHPTHTPGALAGSNIPSPEIRFVTVMVSANLPAAGVAHARTTVIRITAASSLSTAAR